MPETSVWSQIEMLKQLTSHDLTMTTITSKCLSNPEIRKLTKGGTHCLWSIIQHWIRSAFQVRWCKRGRNVHDQIQAGKAIEVHRVIKTVNKRMFPSKWKHSSIQQKWVEIAETNYLGTSKDSVHTLLLGVHPRFQANEESLRKPHQNWNLSIIDVFKKIILILLSQWEKIQK